MKKVILSWFVGLEQEGCLLDGWRACLKYLKGGEIEKRGGEMGALKREAGTLLTMIRR